jgi:hypothetical protein
MTIKEQRVNEIASDAIAAYNAILAKPAGLLPMVTEASKPTRIKNVTRSIQLASGICKQLYGDKRITPVFWQQYFTECKNDDFLAGRGPYSQSHSNWTPDFEYLTRPATLTRVFEKAVSR